MLIEINCDAGRKRSSFRPDDLEMNVLPLIFFSFQLAIKQRYRFCHRQFSQVAQTHEELLQLTKTSPESSMVQKLAVDSPMLGADVGQPSLWHEYAF